MGVRRHAGRGMTSGACGTAVAGVRVGTTEWERPAVLSSWRSCAMELSRRVATPRAAAWPQRPRRTNGRGCPSRRRGRRYPRAHRGIAATDRRDARCRRPQPGAIVLPRAAARHSVSRPGENAHDDSMGTGGARCPPTTTRPLVRPQGGTPARMRRPERAARLCGGGPIQYAKASQRDAARPQAWFPLPHAMRRPRSGRRRPGRSRRPAPTWRVPARWRASRRSAAHRGPAVLPHAGNDQGQ